jgi:hypothetical protein
VRAGKILLGTKFQGNETCKFKRAKQGESFLTQKVVTLMHDFKDHFQSLKDQEPLTFGEAIFTQSLWSDKAETEDYHEIENEISVEPELGAEELKPMPDTLLDLPLGEKKRILFLCSLEHHEEEGEAHKLLDKMINSLGLDSGDWLKVVDLNALELNEFLYKHQIEFTLAFGGKSLEAVMGEKKRLQEVHGQFFPYSFNGHTTQVMGLFHPDYLLINQKMKKTVWSDMQTFLKELSN